MYYLFIKKETKSHTVIFHLCWPYGEKENDKRAHKIKMPLKQQMNLELEPICSSLKLDLASCLTIYNLGLLAMQDNKRTLLMKWAL